MNLMHLIKMAFLLAVLLFLVLMGVHNRGVVDFNLPPLMSSVVHQPAALMYFAFFAVGALTGTIITVGRGKPSSPKSDK